MKIFRAYRKLNDTILSNMFAVLTFVLNLFFNILKPDYHWSLIAHLCVEDMLKSVVIEEKKLKNIESEIWT